MSRVTLLLIAALVLALVSGCNKPCPDGKRPHPILVNGQTVSICLNA
jgi:hypothetical protein